MKFSTRISLNGEAEIIAQAGQRGRITVATNMAGRGTDIEIDDEVKQLGGLHVIGTEFHESSRIDQQLFGRCARQGDPGSVQLYFSAEDNLLDAALGRPAAAPLSQDQSSQANELLVTTIQMGSTKSRKPALSYSQDSPS